MQIRDHVEPIAEAVYSALHSSKILPDVEYLSQTPQQRREGTEGEKKLRRPFNHEITCYHFPQTWGSTALGFGGMGGAAMTSAITSVVLCHGVAAVFFGGRHAYTVRDSALLTEDLRNFNMPSVSEAVKYQ